METLEAEPRTRTRAVAKITVHGHQSTPFDERSGPELAELRLNETFTGDMGGESSVRALQVKLAEGSARIVSMQRFR